MISRIPEGSIMMTPAEARIAYDVLGIREKRARLNSSTRAWQILTEITKCAFSERLAAPGNEPWQEAAKDEAGHMTVRQIARKARIPARTVRHHLALGTLPGSKDDRGGWVVDAVDVETYIAARETN